METARQVPIYRALNRPNLFMGAERKPVQTLMAICGTVLVSNPASLPTYLIVGGVYFGSLLALRKLAAKDSRFTEVYSRQLRFRPYYPPRRGLDAKRAKRVLG